MIDRVILVVVAAFIIVGTAAEIIRVRGMDKMTKRALSRAGILLISSGLVGLVLYAFAYERVMYLGMRLWWIVWFVWIVIAAWRIARFVRVEIPAMNKERAAETAFNKWLPKSKK